jgi:hypothetical protein
MTNSFPFLEVELKTSSWVHINAGGNAASVPFVRANQKHMDLVCFGNGPIPSLCIKYDRLEAFAKHAQKNGVRVFWHDSKAEIGA